MAAIHLVTFVIVVVVVLLAQQTYLNFFDKNVLIGLYGSLMVPQIIKDFF